MPAPSTDPPPPHRILLVEDDGAVRAALRDLLEDEGYEVTEAANGVEALDRLRACDAPGLVLLDLMMPVMDGWEVLRRMHEEVIDVPVVVLSASQRPAPGAQAYLAKPPRLDQLLDAVAQYSR